MKGLKSVYCLHDICQKGGGTGYKITRRIKNRVENVKYVDKWFFNPIPLEWDPIWHPLAVFPLFEAWLL